MITNNIRPTSHQKTVLAIVASSPSSKVAAEYIMQNPNTKEAADLLVQIGVLTLDNNEAALTDSGQQLAIDENIIDEMGELTSNGTMYLKMFQKNQSDSESGDDAPIGECVSLIVELLTLMTD